jgi:hypothetical protein
MIDAPYKCTQVTRDPQSYGLPNAEFQRADGKTGWLLVQGPDLFHVEEGVTYVVTIKRADGG